MTNTISKQDELFIERAAIYLAAKGVTNPTQENMVEAMRHVLNKDNEIFEILANNAEIKQLVSDTICTSVWMEAQ